MSPAQPNGYNALFPSQSHPSPGERWEHVGPGWTAAAFFEPWAQGAPTPKYRWAMFDTAAQAAADLARCLDDGMLGGAQPEAARLLRGLRQPGQLALSLSPLWVCVLCPVPPGAHLAEVVDACFAHWRAGFYHRRFELINAGRPVLC